MATRRRTGVWCIVLVGSALLGLPPGAGANTNNPPSSIVRTGRVLCRDGTPKVGCELTFKFYDTTGVVDYATSVTSDGGYFQTTLHCPSINEMAEHVSVTAICCGGQSWLGSPGSCLGSGADFGTFTCDDCGGASCLKPPAGMVAWWPLDETDGTQAADVAGNHPGAYQGTPTPVDGMVGKALSFNGSTDQVQVPDSPALNFGASPGGDFSVDFWLRTTDTDVIASLLDKRDSLIRGYAVFLSGGRLALQLAEGGSGICDSTTPSGCTNYASGVAVADGDWHFIAITVDRDAADGIRWYVDGNEVGTRQDPRLRGDSLTNGAPLHIAAHAFGGHSFAGALDEVEIFDRVLAPEEIAAIHVAGSRGECRDDLTLQHNVSLCPQAAAARTSPHLCNFSSVAQTYDLVFTPATAADDSSCALPGPTGFAVTPLDALPILVPPASCQDVQVAISRPAVPTGTSGVACYRATMRNLDSGAVVDEIGSLSLGNTCGFVFDAQYYRPPFRELQYSFVVLNPGIAPVSFHYGFEGVASSRNLKDLILALSAPAQSFGDRAAAASPVTGTVPIPAGGSATVSVLAQLLASEPLNVQDILLRDLSTGAILASESVRAFSPGCTPGPTVLCLNGGRFEVKVAWRDFAGNTGVGQAVTLTPDTGYFWFFSPANVELVLKVLDGRPINGKFWVFYGALSTVEYAITVTDTETGASRTFSNASGHLASVAETSALPGDAAAALAGASGGGPKAAGTSTALVGLSAALASPHAAATGRTISLLATCDPTATALCLNGSRFRVEVTWQDFQGHAGTGQAVPITGDTGYFWFFNPANVELAVKVIDGTPLNHRWWVFYGALSTVEYRVRVTDTTTGAVKEYPNPSGTLGSVADTSAFPE